MEQNKQVQAINCAIYTRKSTSDGLEQDFTSLDAQRESAESYIQSQKHVGWKALPFRYDDGGFTGASTDRPALQRLLQDIRDKKINCVVVYKVDRLSRSLSDFVKLLQFFEEQKITFVSVTQHFNTNTSMGRLTLNILLSFAQFEREMISERTKDKMGAARKKGKWVGGRAPLGYDYDRLNKRIVVNPKEAELVREIFRLYFEKGSFLKVTTELNAKGYHTKQIQGKKGLLGGVPFKNTNIRMIVNNATYIGKADYEGKLYQGLHEAIIDEETFWKAREQMKRNTRERNISKNRKFQGPLSGILRCAACNSSICHAFQNKNKKQRQYRYYVCLNGIKRGRKVCPLKSFSAVTMEQKVLEFLRRITDDERIRHDKWDSFTSDEQKVILHSLVHSVDYDAHKGLTIIKLKETPEKHEFSFPLYQLKNRMPATTEAAFNQFPPVRRQLLLAHQIRQLMSKGQVRDLHQVAKWAHIHRSRLYQIMNLLYLAPQIQEDIIFRDYPKLAKTTERHLRHITEEIDWQKQIALWKLFLPSEVAR
ncbi:MAG: recombinase family protein [Candidatus Omnitrophica bacterium]|nr:recombinase family protein [Candidatus Omnitrophota bacterium]